MAEELAQLKLFVVEMRDLTAMLVAGGGREPEGGEGGPRESDGLGAG
jgi:hypothetical protein